MFNDISKEKPERNLYFIRAADIVGGGSQTRLWAHKPAFVLPAYVSSVIQKWGSETKKYAIHLCQSVYSFYLNFISLDFKNISTSKDIQNIKYLLSLKRINFIFCLIKMTSNYY